MPRLAIFLVTCLAATTLASQEKEESLAQRIDEMLAPAYPNGEPGAAVIATKGGKVIFRKGYGMASVELGVKVDPGHAFCLASVTKPFTAMAILALVEDGKVSLSDKASKFHPKLDLDERITVEHLLSHRTGLSDFTRMKAYDHSHIHAKIDPDELCEAAKGQKLSFEPGAKFGYCNLNYALLARIVEVASGKSWEAFLKERIFEPAEMKRSTCGGHDRIIPHAVTGYAREGKEWRRSRALSFTRGFGLGGILSTVDDLAAWDVAFRAGKILKPETIDHMQTPPKLADGKLSAYALGWIVRSNRGHEFVYHAGGIYGWRAMLVRIPKEKVFVAILTNRATKDNPLTKLATHIAYLLAK